MPDIWHEVTIGATPSEVFEAITEEHGLAAWWTAHITAEPKVGALIQARFFGGNSIHALEIVKLKPSETVEWHIRRSFLDWEGTTIGWTLSPAENGTKVLFGHQSFATADGSLPKVSYGWAVYLTGLKQYLETGKGNPHTY